MTSLTKRKKRKPRAYKTPRCSTQRCSKPAKLGPFCTSHAMREADKLFSLYIRNRDGRCTAAGMFDLACSGPLACAHIVGRRNYRLRYDPRNAAALCNAAHHMMVDQHGREGHKATWATRVLGPEGYNQLMTDALESADRNTAISEALEWLEGGVEG